MQYGQRKLQRSITEMRRSRIGRASVSRGAERAFRGTMTSRTAMRAAQYEHHGGQWLSVEGEGVGPGPGRHAGGSARQDQRYRRVTNPFGQVFGPGGSSTKPAVPASAMKSPDPLVGAGIAQLRQQSSCSSRTGRNKGRGGFTVTASPSATRSGGKGCWPRLPLSEGST